MSNQFPRFPGAMSRRSLLFGLTGAGALVLMGCAQNGDEANASAVQGKPGAAADTANPVASSASMTLFKDPNCGCCGSWAELAREAGYGVTVRNDQDMTAVKRRLGVPEDLASCHTTQVAGYVVEGHVPLAEVARLLRERPAGVKGIAVPGMPAGSPGMEVPGGRTEPFQVIAFDDSGRRSVFASYPAARAN